MYYLLSAVVLLLLYACGLGLTLLICPKRLEKYLYVLAPFLGVAVIGWFARIMHFWFGLGLQTSYPWLLALCPVLMFAGMLVRYRQDNVNWRKIFTAPFEKASRADTWLPAGLCLAAFLIVSVPDSQGLHHMINPDPPNYAIVSNMLRYWDTLAPDSFTKTAPITFIKDSWGFSIYAALAAGASVFDVKAYDVFPALINLLYALSAAGVFVLAREVFACRTRTAFAIGALYALNAFAYGVDHYGFLNQTLFIGLLPLFLVAGLGLYEQCKACGSLADVLRRGWREIALFMLIALLAFDTYPFMILIASAILATVAFAMTLVTRHWRAFIISLGVGASALILGCVIFPVISSVTSISGANVGWSLPMIDMTVVLGFRSLSAAAPVLVWAANIVIFGLICYHHIRAWKKNTAITSGVAIILLTAGYLWLFFFSGETVIYRHFKLITSFMPLYLCAALSVFVPDNDAALAAYGMPEAESRRSKAPLLQSPVYRIACSAAFGAALLVCGARMFTTVRAEAGAGLAVRPAMRELEAIDQNDSVYSINLLESNVIDHMWQFTLLPNKKIYSAYASYYPASPQMLGEWTLIKASALEGSDIGGAQVAFRNAEFALVEHSALTRAATVSEDSAAVIHMGDELNAYLLRGGWYDIQGDSRWSNESARVEFYSDNALPIVMDLTAHTYGFSGDTEIWVNDILIDTVRPTGAVRAKIPADVLSASGVQQVVLKNTGALTPKAAEGKADIRVLGIYCSRIAFSVLAQQEMVTENNDVIIEMGVNEDSYIRDGWHSLEGGFRWTGPSATFSFLSDNAAPVSMEIIAHTYEHSGATQIWVNGTLIDTIKPVGSATVDIPAEALNPDGDQEVELRNTQAGSPILYGEGDDVRELGIFCSKIVLWRE